MRANVTAIAPLAAPAPPPPMHVVAPPPPAVVQKKPTRKDDAKDGPMLIGVGTALVVITYGGIVAAAATREDDPNAHYGYIPAAGPALWAIKGEEFSEDGWDIPALFFGLVQVGGLGAFVTGIVLTKQQPKPKVTLGVTGDGVFIAGRW